MANIDDTFTASALGDVVVDCGCAPKGVADGPAPDGCGYLVKRIPSK